MRPRLGLAVLFDSGLPGALDVGVSLDGDYRPVNGFAVLVHDRSADRQFARGVGLRAALLRRFRGDLQFQLSGGEFVQRGIGVNRITEGRASNPLALKRECARALTGFPSRIAIEFAFVQRHLATRWHLGDAPHLASFGRVPRELDHLAGWIEDLRGVLDKERPDVLELDDFHREIPNPGDDLYLLAEVVRALLAGAEPQTGLKALDLLPPGRERLFFFLLLRLLLGFLHFEFQFAGSELAQSGVDLDRRHDGVSEDPLVLNAELPRSVNDFEVRVLGFAHRPQCGPPFIQFDFLSGGKGHIRRGMQYLSTKKGPEWDWLARNVYHGGEILFEERGDVLEPDLFLADVANACD